MSASVEDISPHPDPVVLALHVVATLYATGVIWALQLITYPALRFADPARFEAMIDSHARWIPRIMVPAMVVELATGLLLLIQGNAAWEHRGGPWSPFRNLLALSLWQLAVVWASMAIFQGTARARLRDGSESAALRSLLGWNLIPTMGWTARTTIVLVLLVMSLHLGRVR